MKRIVFYVFALAGVFSLGGAEPYIGYLYPCGGRRGTTVKIIAGGQSMRPNGFAVEGEGVKIVGSHPVYPMNNMAKSQRQYYEKWMKGIDAGDPAPPPLPPESERADWRKYRNEEFFGTMDELARLMSLRGAYIKRNALQDTPSIRQMIVLELEIAPDAPAGVRTVRNVGGGGVSAPRLFYIDDAEHFSDGGYVLPFRKAPPRPKAEVFPAVLDGQIMPGETDRFTLRLQKGTPYGIRVAARKLQPFIGDAVPGYCQTVLTLYGPDGKQVACADDDGFDPDPVMRFVPDADGEYTLTIRDALFRGREDFVYRIECREGDFERPVPASPFSPDIREIDAAEAARSVADARGEVVVRGAFAPGKIEAFRVSGRAGDELVLDASARRRGSLADTVLRLFSPDGKLLAENDDAPRSVNAGEIVQHIDSYLRFKLPEAGEYRVELAERSGRGGEDHFYFLRIGRPRPGFEVFTSRSGFAPAGRAEKTIRIAAERRDGFEGEIRITSATPGVMVSGVVPAGKNEGEMTLAGDRRNPAPVFSLRFHAVGVGANGVSVPGKVTAADEYMQAFAYTHFLPAGEFMVYQRLPGPRPPARRKPEGAPERRKP